MSTKTNILLLLLPLLITAAIIITTNKRGHFGFYKMKSLEQYFVFILNLFHSSAVTKLAFVGYMSKVDALLRQSYIFF